MTSLPLDVARIYLEPAVEGYARGREILARFPWAERIPVESHWRIPDLREADPGDYLAAKRQALVLGVKKGLTFRPNGRSADFIAPSSSNGCAMACAYCYVARRKGHANPVSVFVNIEAIAAAIARHATRQGPKTVLNQVDSQSWVYDLGENGDLSVDASISYQPPLTLTHREFRSSRISRKLARVRSSAKVSVKGGWYQTTCGT